MDFVWAIWGDGGEGDFAAVDFVATRAEFYGIAGTDAIEAAGRLEQRAPAVGVADPDVAEGGGGGLREGFPLVAAIEHLDHAATGEAGALGIDMEGAWHGAGVDGVLDAERDGVGGEEAAVELDGGGERGGIARGGEAHDGDEGGPIDEVHALEAAGAAIVEARLAWAGEDVAALIEATASGAAEHLEEFIGLDLAFEIAGEVARVRDYDGAHAEIDAGCEAHGGDDHAKVAVLCQRLDDAGAQGVAHAAVMVSDAGGEHL